MSTMNFNGTFITLEPVSYDENEDGVFVEHARLYISHEPAGEIWQDSDEGCCLSTEYNVSSDVLDILIDAGNQLNKQLEDDQFDMIGAPEMDVIHMLEQKAISAYASLLCL